MGSFVAASLKNSGHDVLWCSEGRGSLTRERAEKYGLRDCIDLRTLCSEAEAILSVCPPHAAESLAGQVIALEFNGIFVECNPLAPRKLAGIHAGFQSRSITFVDGGIVGNPDWEQGTTMLYVAGQMADQVPEWFHKGPLKVTVLDDTIGRATALKLCYAAYTKGTTALLAAILATAESFGVREALEGQWNSDWPGFDEQARRRATRVTAKAWRFAPEMQEIAATFEEAGLPGLFHQGAAVIYERLRDFRDYDGIPELADVLHALIEDGKGD